MLYRPLRSRGCQRLGSTNSLKKKLKKSDKWGFLEKEERDICVG